MSEKSRILILDDEKNYLLVLEALLSDAGYDVTPINDPEMAVSYLEEAEVDVVITDMKMPKMSGLDVLQQIKRSSPSIPVLIMTAFGSIESADPYEPGYYRSFYQRFYRLSHEGIALSI